MAWDPTVLSLLAFLAAGVVAALTVVGWRREDGARTFTVLMAMVTVWATLYGVQLGFSTVAEQLPWQRAVLATSGTIPPLFLSFARRYAGESERPGRRFGGLLVAESAAFAALALTNPSHGLVWSGATLRRGPVSPVLDLEFAGGYFLHVLFAYSVVTIALWTVLSVYFRSTWIHRRQSALLLIGATPAFAAHILYTLKASPVAGLDLTPFAFAFTGVTYGLALFHFDLLERTPIAHRRAIEVTGDGLLVVDSDGLIVDSNRVARQLYGLDRAGEPHVSTALGATDPGALDGTTTSGVVDGARRVYELFVSDLSREPSADAGSAIVLSDVTDRDAYEQRLEVANRVLRHNLRNDMNVVMGSAEALAERTSSDEQERLARVIRSKAGELLDLSEKARRMVDVDETARHDGGSVAVASVLAPLAEEFRERYPSVPLTVACPDDAEAVASERALTVALENLLENAAEHNDAATLTVGVAVTTDGRRTRIEVSDTGSGLPEMERDVLTEHVETPLRHSSGLGLWLTYWTVSASGGEISVDASNSEGTTIALTFPGRSTAGSDAAERRPVRPGE